MPITLEQYKQHAPGTVGTEEDAVLTALLSQAEALLAGWCGWARADDGSLGFGAATYTVQIEGPAVRDPGLLRLPVAWVASVEEVLVSEAWAWAGADELVVDEDLVVDQRRSALRITPTGSLAGWPSGSATRVAFTGGWATYPPEVVVVIAVLARHLYTSRNGEQLQAMAFDGQSATRRDRAAIPQHVQAMARAAQLVVWGSRAA